MLPPPSNKAMSRTLCSYVTNILQLLLSVSGGITQARLINPDEYRDPKVRRISVILGSLYGFGASKSSEFQKYAEQRLVGMFLLNGKFGCHSDLLLGLM